MFINSRMVVDVGLCDKVGKVVSVFRKMRRSVVDVF